MAEEQAPVARPESSSDSSSDEDPYKELLGTMDLNRKPVVVSSEEEEDEDAGTDVEDEAVADEGEIGEEAAGDSDSDGEQEEDEENEEESEDEVDAAEEKVGQINVFQNDPIF